MGVRLSVLVWVVVLQVTTRYVDLQPVGMGAFGLVCSAKDEVSIQSNLDWFDWPSRPLGGDRAFGFGFVAELKARSAYDG